MIASAVVSTALAYFAWHRRPAPGATSFCLLMLAVAEWSLGYALELASTDLSTTIFWDNMAWLGAAFAPTLWFAFALQYTDQARWLTRRNVAILAIEPLITLLLVWTNGFHGLISSNIRVDTSGSFSALVVTYGPWYWINIAYSYLLLFLGAILICLLIQTMAGERTNDLWPEPISSPGSHPFCFYCHGRRHGFKSVSLPAVGHCASGARSSVRKHE